MTVFEEKMDFYTCKVISILESVDQYQDSIFEKLMALEEKNDKLELALKKTKNELRDA